MANNILLDELDPSLLPVENPMPTPGTITNNADDLLKTYNLLSSPDALSQNKSDYENKMSNLNTGLAFANLGDVIAGQKVGSQFPYFQSVQGDIEKKSLTDAAQRKQLLDSYLKSKYYESQSAKDQLDAMFKQSQIESANKKFEFSKEAFAKNMAEKEKYRLAYEERNKAMMGKGGQNKLDFQNLPKEDQVMVTTLGNQKAKSTIVNNLMDPLMQQMDDPKIAESQKVVSALEQLKLLNSQLGPDALGAGETERVSRWLKTAPDPIIGKFGIGPDIKKFSEQLKNALNRNKKTIQSLDNQINIIYGRSTKTPQMKNETKIINGATYEKTQGGWKKVGQ